MPNNGKLMPNLDEKTTKVLNLTVLQRVDPFVKEILITAGHVTFYEFNVNSNQWSRKDVEGSLFVVKRNTQPRFQFIVMNRRNTDNLVENLLGDFEYEIQLPYLLYRNASQEVNGIWFYNARECEDVANLFNRILNAYSKVPTKTKVSSKSEFEELESVPTLSVMDGPLEPSSSTNNTVPDVNDDPSFVNFFSTAMNVGGFSNPATSPQPNHSSTVVSTSRVAVSNLPALQIPSPLPPRTPETITILTRSTDLVKPSSFFTPPLSPSTSPVTISPITAALNGPPLTPPGSLQRPYGTPMLQPFPPPTPGPLLTPSTPNYGPMLNREKVREALQVLIQDNQFIDMVYRAMMNVHQS